MQQTYVLGFFLTTWPTSALIISYLFCMLFKQIFTAVLDGSKNLNTTRFFGYFNLFFLIRFDKKQAIRK